MMSLFNIKTLKQTTTWLRGKYRHILPSIAAHPRLRLKQPRLSFQQSQRCNVAVCAHETKLFTGKTKINLSQKQKPIGNWWQKMVSGQGSCITAPCR